MNNIDLITQKFKAKSTPNSYANPVPNPNPISLTIITCCYVTPATNVLLYY